MKTVLVVLGCALVAGCNVYDASEPLRAKIEKADCKYREELPDTDGTSTFLYRIQVRGELQGSTETDASATITRLDWTPDLSCPDWGDNCRRDTWESGTTPFHSTIDLVMSEQEEGFLFRIEVNGLDPEYGDEFIGVNDAAPVTCERYQD